MHEFVISRYSRYNIYIKSIDIGEDQMLKIILNSLECKQYLGDKRFVESINAHFDRVKKQE